MPIYSHSQLSMYEGCPLKYKLRYRDRIKRDIEGVEGFDLRKSAYQHRTWWGNDRSHF
ncbi:MAG: PD-(D/E)XK nuclease family protein [Dehalococcoidia bacterium]|nr:PD-(D/E)XK nuclease family protein [Dehalococcoidia bacterium]